MKRNLLFGTLAFMAGSLMAADSQDAVKNAAKQLAEKGNYSWRTTVKTEGGGGGGGGGRFRPGPTEGKTEKGGATSLSMTRGDNTMEAILKGDKGAIKTDSGWTSLADAADDQGPMRFAAMMLRNYKTPAVEAGELAGRTKELKAADEGYSGDLSEEGAKQMLTFGRGGGGGGNGPEISGAKGTARFWLKEGTLSKYEVHVEGKVSFNGNDRDVNRTTTVEIKDVGATKVTVPEEAAKVLGK
jgi:hypothetical protein